MRQTSLLAWLLPWAFPSVAAAADTLGGPPEPSLAPLAGGAVTLVAAGAAWFGARAALRRRAELVRALAAERFADRAWRASPDAELVVSSEGLVLRANPGALTLLGGTEASLVGTPLAVYVRDPEAARNALDDARGRGTVRGVELEVRRGEGARAVSLDAVRLESPENAPPVVLVRLRDVAEARRLARAGALDLSRAQELLRASSEPLVTTTAEGRILEANDLLARRTGLSLETLRGSRLPQLFTEPSAAAAALDRVLADGLLPPTPLTLRLADGQLTPVALTARVERLADGSPPRILGSLRDLAAEHKAAAERDLRSWLVAGIAKLNAALQAQGATTETGRRVVTEIANHLGAPVGALYLQEVEGDSRALALKASHAYVRRKGVPTRFLPGEGLVGQAALEARQIVVSGLPDHYLQVTSGLGEAPPRHVCVTPLLFEGEVKGAIELGMLEAPSDVALDYLRQAATIIAVALEAAQARERMAAALTRAQELAAELETQQEKLRSTNAELEEQTVSLRASEQRLTAQQAEIELSNSELRQKNELLDRQRTETEAARRELAVRAEEVALASKYKSEFLANMSHELRTPLNSLLLLARSLRENRDGNLTADQVESATIIYDSGSDLLTLINEILDLSKIEAGKMEVRVAELEVGDLARSLASQFEHMAAAQGLSFTVTVDPAVPATIRSDAQRVGQVLKNLVGNAIKFTERGGVTVSVTRPAPEAQLTRSGLDPSRAVAVHVTDTGIGIAPDMQKLIFEAFQQAESGDRRRFGGTGLGLSISRELATLLGGEIQLRSAPGEGSTFTLYLPESLTGSGEVARRPTAPPRPQTPPPAPPAPRPPSAPPDDRDQIREGDRVILVIEDDLRFAKVLADHVRQRGFRCLCAASGEEGLELAREHRPDGVVLDIGLPGADGWSVLTALKQDVSVRHIPVHIVSAEPASASNMGIGAIGHAPKPISREQIDEVLSRLESASAHSDKRVLVVEDDPVMRQETTRIIGNGNVKVHAVGTAHEALAALREGPWALVVMDLGLPDLPGVELLKQLASEGVRMPPVIVHTVRELTMEEELFLRNYSDSIIIKDVRSQERLIDEVALFLHRVVRELPEAKRRAIQHVRESDEALRGRKVLIVEDDMRTMFAMARMLAAHGIHPIKAENGQRALEALQQHPDTALVLLDMMMPVMDGYETAQRLRAMPQFERLPVIALTAKAMREDRQRCLDAGCTDYLSKPVDPERLASLMRVLLFR